MGFRTPPVRLLLALTIFALAFSQAVGGVRGYLCLCGGQTTVVVDTHCHGPHGEHCHDETGDETPQRHDSESDAEQHEAITIGAITASGTTATIAVSAPALAAPTPAFECAQRPNAAPAPLPEPEVRGSPPHAVAVVRTIVFLI